MTKKVRLSDEEIDELISSHRGYAGLGDSPYSQDEVDRMFGRWEEKMKAEIDKMEDSGDELIGEIISGDEYSDFFWFNRSFRSQEKNGFIRRNSLVREFCAMTAYNALYVTIHNVDVRVQKRRIRWAVWKAMYEGLDEEYDTDYIDYMKIDAPMFRKALRSARIRFGNLEDDIAECDLYEKERVVQLMGRVSTFNAAHLCLLSDDPKTAYSIMCRMIDAYVEYMNSQN